MRDNERLRQLVPLWLERPENKRMEKDLIVFYGWLEQNRPELLKRRYGDPYQQLKVDVGKLIREP